MRRLLLAPLLLSLIGCSNSSDIIVKTDLGETYIVKESAVTINSFTKDDAIRVRRAYSPVEYCKEFLAANSYKITDSDCVTYYSRSGKLALENWIEYDKDLETLQKSKIDLVGKEVTFREIFIDLNKQKNPGSYKTVFCLNYDGIINNYPDAEGERNSFLSALVNGKILKNQPDTKSKLAIESLKNEVCKKYANFEKS